MTHEASSPEDFDTKQADAIDPRLFLDVLIDGLRSQSPRINSKCGQALWCIGPDILGVLRQAADDCRTRPVHRKRLLITVKLILYADPPTVAVGAATVDALMECVRSSDGELVRKVSKAIVCLREFGVTESLVQAAIYNHRDGKYCRRLLEMALLVNGPIQWDTWMAVGLLTIKRSPGVAELASVILFRRLLIRTVGAKDAV